MSLISQAKEKGVSLRRTFMIMLIIFVTLMVVLLFSIFQTIQSFNRLSEATDTYIDLQEAADNLMKASDYLTDEAQCYTVLGDRRHMENYFTEAGVTRRRELAIEAMEAQLPDSPALQALKDAMKESLSLMDRECYAMTLMMLAQGDEDVPEAMKDVAISPDDQKLSAEEKKQRAREMMHDDAYYDQKNMIRSNLTQCIEELKTGTRSTQSSMQKIVHSELTGMVILIIVQSLAIIILLRITTSLGINPLLQAVEYIRHDQMLPVTGAYEYRYLANTYNSMYTAYKESMATAENAARNAETIAELRESINALFNNIPGMSFSKDAETGVYLACNQAFVEYAQRQSTEDVLGLTDAEIFDPVTASHFVETDRKALSMEDPYVYYEDVKDAAGNPHQLQTTKLKFVDSTGRLCLLGMCADVTDLRAQAQANSMITAMASDYRCVYYVNLDVDDGVCYQDDPADPNQTPKGVHFRYLEWITRYAEERVSDMYREGFLDFVNPDNIRQQLATQPIIAYRYLVRREGREYYEMIRAAGVRRAEERDDHMVHAIGMGFTTIDAEMRETMARNEALAEALSVAEEASKAKTTFLSNMSHEIRTPMNAIIGLDTLALHDDNISPQTREYLEKIGDSARHLLALINDILDMSRIESGRTVLRKEEFSFSAMLEQINTMVMSQCDDKGLRYECRMLSRVDDYYIGDDMKIKEVLINILSNAIKFTDAPGDITLTVEKTAEFDGQSTIRFRVRDTGIGMDEEFIPKIYDTFSQADSGRTSKYGSTGLGMAITRNIVEMMNGTIYVESEKGVGTEFTVSLTLKNVEHQVSERDNAIDPGSMHVLVVDDEEIPAEHARMVLEDAGIHADVCLSGEDALRMLEVQHVKQTPYNLVLLDWKMPGMDCIDVAKEIRERFSSETVIIVLTAYNWDEIVEDATRAGVDGFLSKPLFAGNVIAEFERAAHRSNMSLLEEKQRAELAGRRILLAEDMEINAEIMMDVLEMEDMQADHAENGKIAVEMFENSAPGTYSAILMDVRMPEMDGLEAAAAIRALDRPDAARIPIIALTANAFDEDVQRSLQAGMNAHLSKPVEPDHLYQTLEELIYKAENQHSESRAAGAERTL